MLEKLLPFPLRRLGRHKLTTMINILGLTLGILSCLVIYLYVSFEFSYDTFHADRDRIYRIGVWTIGSDGKINEGASLPPPLAADLRREATGFSTVAGIYTDDCKVLIPGTGKPDRVFPGIQEGQRQHIAFADPEYLEIFHHKWLAGNPATALKAPFSVVLTKSEATRYFGHGSPADWMGRSVVYYDSLTVSVSGIVEEWQQNSDFAFTDLISYSTIGHSWVRNDISGWNAFESSANAFVKLSPGTTVAQVEKQFPAFFKLHEPFIGDSKGGLKLQPLADIHFNSAFGDDYGRRAHKPTLYALAGIALFILLIAVINFVNLSTAQAVLRAREVGVRKVLGSSRAGLVWQFLSETGIIVVVAAALALLLANPVITALQGGLRSGPSGLPEGVRFRIADPSTWVFIGLTITLTCLLAGYYPARALSSFLPVIALRGQGSQHLNASSYLRKGLIVFQFAVSMVFILGTIMMGRQIRYMINTDLGFKKDAIVTIGLPGGEWNQRTALAAEISRISGVRQVCFSSNSPEARGHNGTVLENRGATYVRIDAGYDFIDTGFIPLYGMTLIAGRNFLPSDSLRMGRTPATGYRAFIINESAAKALGFSRPADAVGHRVSSALGGVIGPVLGVVKDFNSTSLRDKIGPFFFTYQRDAGGLLSVKLASANLSGGSIKRILGRMEALFARNYPKEQFDPRFFDETIARLYQREHQTAWMVNIGMGIAIFISCMGLFGLAAFTSNQRIREIGIRKVLGASVPDLVSLLSREFIVLVLVAMLIAAPLAGWGIHQWLQDFAYRTTMPWWIYVMGGFAAIVIALLTVGFQTVRAASANPVNSLRSE
ncbi:MAG TPA: ABC transporter permease [Puia sp.]|nr:ABC transporter permease [Puia sp.]